jgi:hypothetical protein
VNVKKYHLVLKGDPTYEEARRLIESAYRKAFQSRVAPCPPMILTLAERSEREGSVLACVALSHGDRVPFFSERYLGDLPAEAAIGKTLGRSIDRKEVVEVGGLAARSHGAGAQLVSHTPWFVLGLGFRYGLVTATRPVRFLLGTAGMAFVPMVPASRESLPEGEREPWGTYYDNDPITGVIDFLASCHTVAAQRTQPYSVHEMVLTVLDQKVG